MFCPPQTTTNHPAPIIHIKLINILYGANFKTNINMVNVYNILVLQSCLPFLGICGKKNLQSTYNQLCVKYKLQEAASMYNLSLMLHNYSRE